MLARGGPAGSQVVSAGQPGRVLRDWGCARGWGAGAGRAGGESAAAAAGGGRVRGLLRDHADVRVPALLSLRTRTGDWRRPAPHGRASPLPAPRPPPLLAPAPGPRGALLVATGCLSTSAPRRPSVNPRWWRMCVRVLRAQAPVCPSARVTACVCSCVSGSPGVCVCPSVRVTACAPSVDPWWEGGLWTKVGLPGGWGVAVQTGWRPP